MRKLRRKAILLSLICIIFIFPACLERSNPLDPKGNSNIIVPPRVTSLRLQAAGTNVFLSWDRMEGVKEYILYRSSTFRGDYEEIRPRIPQPDDGTRVEFTDTGVMPGFPYFYDISAVSPEGLEGRRLERPEGIRVLQN